MTALARPRWEDFDYELHNDNPMGWFGDGWTVAERTGDAQGMSWYIDESRMLHLGVEEEDKLRAKGSGETNSGQGEVKEASKIAEDSVEMDGVAREAGGVIEG